MLCSEQIHPFLYMDYLSPHPKLFVYSNKRFHTRMGLISSLVVSFLFFILITSFIVGFFNGNGMVVVFSKDKSDQDFYFNMTNHLFAFNLSRFKHGSVDPRAVDIKVYYWEYYGSDRIPMEITYERCNFTKHFKEDKYDEVFKTLGVNNFFCLNTNTINMSLFYRPYDWSGSHITLYFTTCVNTTQNNDFCYSKDIIEQYMRNDSFFFSFVVDNTEINHYNRSYPLRSIKYFKSVRISYISRVDLTMFWRPVDYITDKGWIFDRKSTSRTYQLDDTLSHQNFPIEGEVYHVPMTFSKIQFELYYATIEKYERTYPKIQSMIASISGIVQVVFHAFNYIVYSCSLGQYYASFLNVLPSNEISKENDFKTKPRTPSITMVSNFSEAQLNLCNDKDKQNQISLTKEKKPFSKVQPIFVKTKTDIDGNTKAIFTKTLKNKRAYGVSCIKSFYWFISSRHQKRKSEISLIERFVRENVSVDGLMRMMVQQNHIVNYVRTYSNYSKGRKNNLNKSVIPFSHYVMNAKMEGNQEVLINKKYINMKTLSGRNQKTNKTTMVGYKFGKN